MNDCLMFYERIKELSKSQNRQIRDVVESSGVIYSSYNSCKRYGNLPRADEAVAIASSLGTTVEYLVTGKTSSNEEAKALLKAALEKL